MYLLNVQQVCVKKPAYHRQAGFFVYLYNDRVYISTPLNVTLFTNVSPHHKQQHMLP